MRDHNKAFCQLVAETFDCPGPVYEFGSYQVEGQLDYADLRSLFPGKDYVGCDMRPGPGVDRVEDVSAISLPDQSAGTVLCIETFEHVFEVRRAFDEVFRVLKPGGVFVITSPLNFRIHGYPDDYWRMTPNCLRRMMAPYAARLSGYQGYHKFPHTVMAIGFKAPAPADFARRADELIIAYRSWLRRHRGEPPFSQKIRRGLAQVYRSKGERQQVSAYYSADFTLDVASPRQRRLRSAGGAGGSFRHGLRVSDADDARSPRHPRTRRRDLDGARPDASARADAQPRRAAGAIGPRNAAVVHTARDDGRLDHHDDRLRPGAARSLRPPLLRRRRRPDES